MCGCPRGFPTAPVLSSWHNTTAPYHVSCQASQILTHVHTRQARTPMRHKSNPAGQQHAPHRFPSVAYLARELTKPLGKRNQVYKADNCLLLPFAEWCLPPRHPLLSNFICDIRCQPTVGNSSAFPPPNPACGPQTPTFPILIALHTDVFFVERPKSCSIS